MAALDGCARTQQGGSQRRGGAHKTSFYQGGVSTKGSEARKAGEAREEKGEVAGIAKTNQT